MRRAVGIPSRVLLVVPHGGGGPANLWPMVTKLPADWDVFGLLLPGRESRFGESPNWTFAEVTEEAAAEAAVLTRTTPGAEVPLVAAGQCLGAWLIYAILGNDTYGLQHRCRKFFAFSQGPWSARGAGVPLPASSDAMWERLIASGDTSPALAADEEFRAYQEPIIRADYRVLSQLPTDVAPLACSMVAVAGSHDKTAPHMQLGDWARYTNDFDIIWCACGHMPMQELPAEAARIVVSRG